LAELFPGAGAAQAPARGIIATTVTSRLRKDCLIIVLSPLSLSIVPG
jgi:hypothetical protein